MQLPGQVSGTTLVQHETICITIWKTRGMPFAYLGETPRTALARLGRKRRGGKGVASRQPFTPHYPLSEKTPTQAYYVEDVSIVYQQQSTGSCSQSAQLHAGPSASRLV